MGQTPWRPVPRGARLMNSRRRIKPGRPNNGESILGPRGRRADCPARPCEHSGPVVQESVRGARACHRGPTRGTASCGTLWRSGPRRMRLPLGQRRRQVGSGSRACLCDSRSGEPRSEYGALPVVQDKSCASVLLPLGPGPWR